MKVCHMCDPLYLFLLNDELTENSNLFQYSILDMNIDIVLLCQVVDIFS